MKRLFVFVMVMILCFSSTISFAEKNTDVIITLNGVRLTLLNEKGEIVQPIIQDGQVFVPIKEFVETIGGSYSFDEKTASITVLLNQQQASNTPQKNAITSENFSYYFDVSCYLSNVKEKKSDNGVMFTCNYTADINVEIKPKKAVEIDDIELNYVVNLVEKPNGTKDAVNIKGKITDNNEVTVIKKKYEWSSSWLYSYNPSTVEIVSSNVFQASGFVIE